MDRWVKLDDRLPKNHTDVLVIFNRRLRGRKRQVRVARYYRNDEWYVCAEIEVTGYYDNSHIEAWMDVPELPEADTPVS